MSYGKILFSKSDLDKDIDLKAIELMGKVDYIRKSNGEIIKQVVFKNNGNITGDINNCDTIIVYGNITGNIKAENVIVIDGKINDSKISAETILNVEKKKEKELAKWKSLRGKFYCSSCHYEAILPHSYCPFCGSKMEDEILYL